MRQTPPWDLSASKETRTLGGRMARPCWLGLEEGWGVWGGHSGNQAACGARRHLPASVHSLLPRGARIPCGAPDGCGYVTQMFVDRSAGRMRGVGLCMCVCSQGCVHTCVPGGIGTCRGLSTWVPRTQGWGPHHTCLGVQCTLHVWASLDTQAWMRCGSTQVGMGRDRCSLGAHQAPHNSASALVQKNCQMGKLRAAACLRPQGSCL